MIKSFVTGTLQAKFPTLRIHVSAVLRERFLITGSRHRNVKLETLKLYIRATATELEESFPRNEEKGNLVNNMDQEWNWLLAIETCARASLNAYIGQACVRVTKARY